MPLHPETPDLIIIPTYNERANIRALVPEVINAAPKAHIWVVDDNSPDGTAEEVQMLSVEHSGITLISRQKKEGLGRAYSDALTRAKSENIRSVILMDADGSHDPKYLPFLLSKIPEYGLVVASRYSGEGSTPGWEAWRRALSSGGNMYARLLTGLPVHDLTAGYIALDKTVLDKLDLSSISAAGYAFQIQLKYRAIRDAGARPYEIPIVFRERREGESKLSRHIVWEGVQAPLRILAERVRRSLSL